MKKRVIDVEFNREQQQLVELLEQGAASLQQGRTVDGEDAYRRMRARISERRAELASRRAATKPPAAKVHKR